MEVVGVVAAAVQLAGVARSLRTLITRIRVAEETMQMRLQQIQSLIAIAGTIKRNQPQLDTPEIHVMVHRCLTEATALEAVLEGSKDTANRIERLRHVYRGFVMESKVGEIMARLEREKSALVLCISVIDS